MVGDANLEVAICAFYLHREITYFCSYYLKSVSLLSNTYLQNNPKVGSNEGVYSTLSILKKFGYPSGSCKYYWIDYNEFCYC